MSTDLPCTYNLPVVPAIKLPKLRCPIVCVFSRLYLFDSFVLSPFLVKRHPSSQTVTFQIIGPCGIWKFIWDVYRKSLNLSSVCLSTWLWCVSLWPGFWILSFFLNPFQPFSITRYCNLSSTTLFIFQMRKVNSCLNEHKLPAGWQTLAQKLTGWSPIENLGRSRLTFGTCGSMASSI